MHPTKEAASQQQLHGHWISNREALRYEKSSFSLSVLQSVLTGHKCVGRSSHLNSHACSTEMSSSKGSTGPVSRCHSTDSCRAWGCGNWLPKWVVSGVKALFRAKWPSEKPQCCNSWQGTRAEQGGAGVQQLGHCPWDTQPPTINTRAVTHCSQPRSPALPPPCGTDRAGGTAQGTRPPHLQNWLAVQSASLAPSAPEPAR